MINTIEELYENQSMLDYLNNKDMEDICQMLEHANPTVRWLASDKSPAFSKYRRYRISIGDYTLEKANDKHCRLVDNNSHKMRAHGSEDLFIKTIVRKAHEKKHISELDGKEYGLVFGGGGAKGAYEIGVWKALREFGIEEKITGISGASVGSLNGALFLQGDLELAEKTWNNLEQKDLTHFSPLNLDQTYSEDFSPDGIVTSFADLVANHQYITFVNHRLKKIIEETIKDASIFDDKLFYACTTMRGYLSTQKTDNKTEVKWLVPVYVPFVEMNFEEIKRFLIASASIPIFFRKQRIDHVSYVDGGILDNVPVTPLVNAGFKKIIVVDLEHNNVSSHKKVFNGYTIYYISPSYFLGDLKDTVKVDNNKINKDMDMGYKDTCSFLGSDICEDL